MIIWLDHIHRVNSRIEPLNRVGFLKKKNYPVDRTFDHLAFSCILGKKIEVELHDREGEIRLREPCCLLAMPGQNRKLIPHFPFDEFYFVFEQPSVPLLFHESLPLLPPHQMIPLEKVPLIRDYIRLMLKLLRRRLSGSLCSQLDHLACSILESTYWNRSGEPHVRQDVKMTALEDYIHRNYHKTLDMDALARKFGMSYATFRRLWASRHKHPPHTEILRLRNREAKELLKDPGLPVGKVAELVGYGDARYFSRFFRAQNRMTPGEFRTRELAKIPSVPQP